MKVTTGPDTGLTTCELHQQDRKTLADAKTVFEKLAFHLRGTPEGASAKVLCAGIEEMLSANTCPDTSGADSAVDPKATP